MNGSQSSIPPPLVDRLRFCAQLWAEANDATFARLGTIVINDGGFFTRVESTASTTTKTLERFARFLGDAGQWPDGAVPSAVREFVHVVGVTPDSPTPSPDNLAQNIELLPAGDASASGPAGRTPSGEGPGLPTPGGKSLAPRTAIEKAVA